VEHAPVDGQGAVVPDGTAAVVTVVGDAVAHRQIVDGHVRTGRDVENAEVRRTRVGRALDGRAVALDRHVAGEHGQAVAALRAVVGRRERVDASALQRDLAAAGLRIRGGNRGNEPGAR